MEMMMMNLVLLLCIALIFVTVNVESEIITNSNSTDHTRSEAVVVSNSNVTDHSKNSTNDAKLSDESETTKKKKRERFVHGEECDPSNMCKDEEDEFVACLRVPGNDAPHLSLLIQNKGKNALVVDIKAPSFVRLEKNKVHLLENEDTKVKVSIRKGKSNETTIVLTSTKGHCNLDLKDITTKDDDTILPTRPSSIFNITTRTLIVIIMISFLILSLVIIPTIIHLYKKKKKSQGVNNNKYQRLDNMELPVSNNAVLVSKSDSGDDYGWDNNWGDDDWGDGENGDEEQPNTPVLPVTPSVSSKGLASRRLSKEGWKD